jgi:hypothetical protein
MREKLWTTVSHGQALPILTQSQLYIAGAKSTRLIVYVEDQALKYGDKVLNLVAQPNLPPTGLPNALGIGAGGRILQNIKRDTNNPRIWDVANAKLLNVQVLESAAFGLVTGTTPPHAPMSAEIYEKIGAVFFQLKQEEGGKRGVAGDWTSLVGVAEGTGRDSRWGGGRLGLLEADGEGEGGVDEYREQSLYFPVVLLDVDDTIPPFKGIEDPDDSDRALN